MATAVHHAPSRHTTQRNPLHLWHLLSLDAPTVATLWTWFAARVVGVRLPWVALPAMFVAVWMLYAADRLLDALKPSSELEERHRFHHRHRNRFLTGIAIGGVALMLMAKYSYPEAVRLYALLAALLAVWFILIHARLGFQRLPKELAVGIFFPAAVFIPTVAHRPDLRLVLLPHALLLAAVCSLNCLFIYAWEHPGSRPRAHWTTRRATQRLVPLTALTGIAALAMQWFAHSFWPIDIACALSALIFLVLDRVHQRVAPTTLRAAADAVLLTPLLLLPFLKP